MESKNKVMKTELRGTAEIILCGFVTIWMNPFTSQLCSIVAIKKLVIAAFITSVIFRQSHRHVVYTAVYHNGRNTGDLTELHHKAWTQANTKQYNKTDGFHNASLTVNKLTTSFAHCVRWSQPTWSNFILQRMFWMWFVVHNSLASVFILLIVLMQDETDA